MKSCATCKHLHKETESWEMPHIWWWECAARPAMANLTSFPFHNTECKSHAPVKVIRPISWYSKDGYGGMK